MQPAIVRTRRLGDARGWFVESYSARRLADLGITASFVQDNHSYSAEAGTLRGLHFQRPPHAQAKLVRCVRGAIWDVVVDIRRGSPTFGRWIAAALTPESGDQMFVPVGYAHGFITLRRDTEVQYKVDDYYAAECDAGLAWDDPTIAVAWPDVGSAPNLSDKDRRQPSLATFDSPFRYDGDPLTELTR